MLFQIRALCAHDPITVSTKEEFYSKAVPVLTAQFYCKDPTEYLRRMRLTIIEDGLVGIVLSLYGIHHGVFVKLGTMKGDIDDFAFLELPVIVLNLKTEM